MSELDPKTPRSDDPLIGRVVSDRYRIVRKLGEGGMGSVYVADHLLVNRKVALKVLLPDVASPEVIDMFLEEARTVARIGHENVIDIFYGGRSPDGFVFLAMEQLEGVDLAAVLRAEGTLPWDRARKILLQMAGALGAVHRHGIVHRDIKPENVFLIHRGTEKEFVKLLDFGVAKVAAGGGKDTAQGTVTGTPEYMAPEQGQAGTIDQRSDIYALGCVMYHMLTGGPPFAGGTIVQIITRHLTETPMPPSLRRPDLTISAEMDAVVMRALEKDPARRYQDMAAFAAAIEQCREGRRSSSRHDAQAVPEQLRVDDSAMHGRKRRRARILILLGVEAVVVSALVAWRAFYPAPGHVTVSVVPSDATVTLDDAPVASRSPVMFDASPGRHTLGVARQGYVTVRRPIDIAPRSTTSIPVALELSKGPGETAETAEAAGATAPSR
jgi:serine/threonine protein kinase